MVEKPTFETTGEITKFDERDTVFSREALVPGSTEEIEYHKLNPEACAAPTVAQGRGGAYQRVQRSIDPTTACTKNVP